MSENEQVSTPRFSDITAVKETLADGTVAVQINNGGLTVEAALPHTGAASVDFGALQTITLDPEYYERMRQNMTIHAHPHSIEGRMDAMEKRFERLLQTLEVMTYNQSADGNWNHYRNFDGTSCGLGGSPPDANAVLKKELTGFQAAMKEMREGPVYLRVYPDGSFKPEHWDVDPA